MTDRQSKRCIRATSWSVVFWLLFTAAVVAEDKPASEPVLEQSLVDEWSAKIYELYAQAKDAGEDVPVNAFEWAKQDLQSAGAWEYKVIRWASTSATETEAVLNRWGEDRWECYWVQPRENEVVLYFKRQRVSKIRSLPFADMLRLLPKLGEDHPSEE